MGMNAQFGRRKRRKRLGQAASEPGGQPAQETQRLFFGVFLNLELQAALSNAQNKLVGKGWKPTPVDQFHITLLFMAAVPKDHIEACKQLAREVASSLPSFEVYVRGSGFFPNEGSPRVWFAKAEGEGLVALANALRQRFAEAFPQFAGDTSEDTLEFRPHITLARKKGPAPRPGPVLFQQQLAVSRFVLVRSTLGRDGAEYETLAHFTLQPCIQPPPEPSPEPHQP
jgi:RNA 2',3'-cyclic 3'-phosphodiesterase